MPVKKINTNHVRFSDGGGGGSNVGGEIKANNKTLNDWVVVDWVVVDWVAVEWVDGYFPMVDDDFVVVEHVEYHDAVVVRRSNEPLCLRENYF